MPSIPSLYDLHDILFNEDASVNYLISNGVFYKDWQCPTCVKPLKLYFKRQRFRCPTKACSYEVPLRRNTFFQNTRLKIHETLLLAYQWLKGDTKASIMVSTGHCSDIVTDFMNHFRNLVANSLDEETIQIGGLNIEVEIDETKMGKRKYNRGHRVEGVWVVGGVERTEARRVFIVKVENRNADTLSAVIERYVAPGSIILTDLWRGYNAIDKNENYIHMTVNHSQGFINKVTGTHTNTIEGTWSGLKRKIPIRARTAKQVDTHLWEFVWRRKNIERLWAGFIDALAEIHYD